MEHLLHMDNKNAGGGRKQPSGIRRLALLGVLAALAIVLSIVESMLPLPTPVPGIKFGLANIVVMYALIFLGWRDALLLAALKALYGFITRGATAGLLSLCGGLLAVAVMSLALYLLKDKISYLALSVLGAIAHNIGQLAVASVLLGTVMWYYAPILLISGIATGTITSLLLRATLPAMRRFLPDK